MLLEQKYIILLYILFKIGEKCNCPNVHQKTNFNVYFSQLQAEIYGNNTDKAHKRLFNISCDLANSSIYFEVGSKVNLGSSKMNLRNQVFIAQIVNKF